MSIKVAKKAKTITYSSYPIGWNKLKDLGWLKYKYIYIYIKYLKKKKKKEEEEEEFGACKYVSCS